MRSVDSYSQETTLALGRALGRFIPPGICITLHGELGSGKTLLTQGIAQGMDISQPVTSPTFTIVNQYTDGRLLLNHMDLYRINDEEELYELGLEDYFDNESVCIIEWPEIADILLPPDCLNITINKKFTANRQWRQIIINAGAIHKDWLEEAKNEYENTLD